MSKDFSNWKELRAVLKHDLRIKKKVLCSIEEWIKVQSKLVENWWIWPKVPVKEPQNIDGAGRCEVFDFPVSQAYACGLFVTLSWTPLLPLLLPLSHLSVYAPVAFWRWMLFTAQSGRNLIVIYGMKFFIYSLQTPCSFSLGNVSRAWLQLGQYATKKCQYLQYLPESLGILRWFVPLIFLARLIL